MPISDFYRGDTKKIYLVFKRKDGTPIDLTGCSVFFTMKSDPKLPDEEAEVTKKVTQHLDPQNGKTLIVIDPQDTNNLEPKKYYYDIQIVTQSGEVYTIEADRVKLLTDITRRTS